MRKNSCQYAKLDAGWQPGLIRLWVKPAPDQQWLVQVDYEAVRMGRRQRDLTTVVYDPRFVRPLLLPPPPED